MNDERLSQNTILASAGCEARGLRRSFSPIRLRCIGSLSLLARQLLARPRADKARFETVSRKLVRIFCDFAVLLALNLAGLYAMEHWRIMESILSPNPSSLHWQVAMAVTFLLVRFTLIVIAPGWLLARLFVLQINGPHSRR